MKDQREFLGVGLSFPVCLNGDGTVSTVEYEEDIDQAIRIILGTEPGERVMRPDFGAGLKRFVFEPVSISTMQLLKQRVEEALVDWEPRIDVIEVRVSSEGPVRNKLLVSIAYRVRLTNTIRNLVYPFYLEEGPAQ